MRKAIVDCLHNVQKKLLEIDDGDVKSFNVIADVSIHNQIFQDDLN